MNYEELRCLCFSQGISLARVLYKGKALIAPQELIPILNRPIDIIPIDSQSQVGMVYRLERKGVLDFRAKWVRPDFELGKYLPGIGLPGDAEPVVNVLSSG